MKIAVITDAHANLPALRAVLGAINNEECELIYHLGDAIAIGPFPSETVDLIRDTKNMKCIIGNHDIYYLNGLPKPQPGWMNDGEVRHQTWTHDQLGDERRSIISKWPFVLQEEFDGVKSIFVHYGLVSFHDNFVGVIPNPTYGELDKIFGEF